MNSYFTSRKSSFNIVKLLNASLYSKSAVIIVRQWAKRKENWRRTILLAAGGKNNKWAFKILPILFDLGVDIGIRDFKTGWMVSHFAAASGNVKLLRFIFDKCEHSISLYDTTNDGSNILHIASRYCKLKVVQLLVDHYKMNIHIRDQKGQTAKEIAIFQVQGIRLLPLLRNP